MAGEEHPQLQGFISELIKRDVEILRREIEIVNTRYMERLQGKVDTLEHKTENLRAFVVGKVENLDQKITSVRETATAIVPEMEKKLQRVSDQVGTAAGETVGTKRTMAWILPIAISVVINLIAMAFVWMRQP